MTGRRVEAGGVATRLVLLLACARFTGLDAPPAEAAFEAAPWGTAGSLGPLVPGYWRRGPEPHNGITAMVGIRRWESIPELSWQRAAAGAARGRWSLGASLERLAFGGYDEQALRLAVAREAGPRGGWGGAVSGGLARWGAAGDRRDAVLVAVSAEWGVAAGIHARIAAEGAVGGAGGAIADHSLVATAAPVAPGWIVGLALETLGASSRLHLVTVCRIAAVDLGCRVTPGPALFGVAIGCNLRGITFDLSRETHPALGALSGAELCVRAGRRGDAP